MRTRFCSWGELGPEDPVSQGWHRVVLRRRLVAALPWLVAEKDPPLLSKPFVATYHRLGLQLLLRAEWSQSEAVEAVFHPH